MSTKLQFQGGHYQGFKDDGTKNAGGTINFYEVGTTTDKDTYTTSDLTVANANPVVLDANGRATIWLNGNYKCVIKDSDGNTIRTEDKINPAEATVSAAYNLISNPSFETDTDSDGVPDNWTLTTETGATNAIDDTDQQHGSNSFKFTSIGNGGGNLITDSFFEVDPNVNIDIQFDIKSSVVDVRNLVEIIFYDSAQASISTTAVYDDSTTNPTSWTVKNTTATPPATARYSKLRLTGCHSSDATAGSTWFDNVVVRNTTSGLVQRVEGTPYVAHQTATTAIPADDTIPQNTEGDEFGTVTITPRLSTNRLKIIMNASMVSGSGLIQVSAALFQDSTADALKAGAVTIPGASYALQMSLVHEMAAGTTSATTFKVRIGPDTGTAYVNGPVAGRMFGGTSSVTLTVEEYAA